MDLGKNTNSRQQETAPDTIAINTNTKNDLLVVQTPNSLFSPRSHAGTTHDRCLHLVELFISKCRGKNEMERDTFVATFSGTSTEESFCTRLFDYLVKSSGLIDIDTCAPDHKLDANSFAKGILRFLEMDQRDRMDFIIHVYDTDGNGFISANELLPLVKAAFLDSELDTSEERLEQALNSIVDSYHTENIDEGGLSNSAVRAIMGECLSELAGIFDKPALPKLVSSPGKRRSSYVEVSTTLNATRTNNLFYATFKTLSSFDVRWDVLKRLLDYQWRFHRPRVIWLCVYIFSNFLVFVIKFLVWRLSPKYQTTRNLMGNSICWAKGFAELSSFNAGLIFFPVCRKFISMLRDNTPFKLWKWVPFNDNIDFHVICGHAIMFAGIGHTIAHLINFSRYSREPSDELWYASPLNGKMKGPRPTFWDMAKTLPGATGFIMIAIMFVAYPIAVFFRRKHFNLFWYSHMLYLIWTIIFVCHGMKHIFQPPHAVWYVLPGFVIYCGERLERFLCQATCKVKVLHAETYDNTTVLYVQKPPHNKFDFTTPGSYASLNISSIATFEWHPFSISSAPGDNFLRFHIRRAGDWTSQLYNCVHNLEESDTMGSLQRRISFLSVAQSGLCNDEGDDDDYEFHLNSTVLPNLKDLSFLYIQGPFGAPTNDFFRYDCLVLVGLGVGVTPFASILRYLLLKWQSYRCPHCQVVNHNLSSHKFIQFNWLTREVSQASTVALSKKCIPLLILNTHLFLRSAGFFYLFFSAKAFLGSLGSCQNYQNWILKVT